jgi:hypothetical protein
MGLTRKRLDIGTKCIKSFEVLMVWLEMVLRADATTDYDHIQIKATNGFQLILIRGIYSE